MLKLTWPQVLAFRLQRHFIEEHATRGDLLSVVSRVCGLHAQVMSSAELAAWARIDGLNQDDVSTALWQKRTLVKSWAMRRTLYLFTAADFPVYLAAFRAFGHFRSDFDDFLRHKAVRDAVHRHGSFRIGCRAEAENLALCFVEPILVILDAILSLDFDVGRVRCGDRIGGRARSIVNVHVHRHGYNLSTESSGARASV